MTNQIWLFGSRPIKSLKRIFITKKSRTFFWNACRPKSQENLQISGLCSAHLSPMKLALKCYPEGCWTTCSVFYFSGLWFFSWTGPVNGSETEALRFNKRFRNTETNVLAIPWNHLFCFILFCCTGVLWRCCLGTAYWIDEIQRLSPYINIFACIRTDNMIHSNLSLF